MRHFLFLFRHSLNLHFLWLKLYFTYLKHIYFAFRHLWNYVFSVKTTPYFDTGLPPLNRRCRMRFTQGRREREGQGAPAPSPPPASHHHHFKYVRYVNCEGGGSRRKKQQQMSKFFHIKSENVKFIHVWITCLID